MKDAPNKGGRPKGYKLSESSKEKIRVYRLGKLHTKEVRKKISESLVGIERSQQTKDKISVSRTDKNKGRNILSELMSMYKDAESRSFLLTNKEIILTWTDVYSEKELFGEEMRCLDVDLENHICAACDLSGTKINN